MGMPLYFLRRHAFLFVPFFYIGRKIHAFFSCRAWLFRGAAPSHGGCGLSWGGRFMQFFHIGRVCLGAQPCHMVGAVYHGVGDSWGCSFPSPTGANASRGWSGSRGRIA